MKQEDFNCVSEKGDLIHRRIFADDSIYDQEIKAIFAKCWLFLGHESMVAEPHDFFQAYMGEESVIVTRDQDRQLRVFLNSCRHRGLPVCRSEKGSAKSFTCPYHGWTYGSDGCLKGMPRAKEYYGDDIIKSDWGLIGVRVDSYKGLMFATFDDDAVSLVDYLGDATYFLDIMVDRTAGGVVALPGVQKWEINSNWKFPSENMIGDTYHAAFSHRSSFILSEDAAKGLEAQEQQGKTVALDGGHGLMCPVQPEDERHQVYTHYEAGIPNASPACEEYLRGQHAEAKQRLGEFRGTLKPASMTIFPNLQIAPGMNCFRVTHPRGAQQSELWNMVLVDSDAPAEMGQAVLDYYTFLFGPDGLVEQDDDENWSQATRGSMSKQADKYPYHLGMGMGLEKPHPELPGLVSPAQSEHAQRHFYRHWQSLMNAEIA